MRDVPVSGAPDGVTSEEHIVGFVNYYMSWFTETSKPPNERLPPARVAYIATLQAVRPESHPDVMGIAIPTTMRDALPLSSSTCAPPGTADRNTLLVSPPHSSQRLNVRAVGSTMSAIASPARRDVRGNLHAPLPPAAPPTVLSTAGTDNMTICLPVGSGKQESFAAMAPTVRVSSTAPTLSSLSNVNLGADFARGMHGVAASGSAPATLLYNPAYALPVNTGGLPHLMPQFPLHVPLVHNVYNVSNAFGAAALPSVIPPPPMRPSEQRPPKASRRRPATNKRQRQGVPLVVDDAAPHSYAAEGVVADATVTGSEGAAAGTAPSRSARGRVRSTVRRARAATEADVVSGDHTTARVPARGRGLSAARRRRARPSIDRNGDDDAEDDVEHNGEDENVDMRDDSAPRPIGRDASSEVDAYPSGGYKSDASRSGSGSEEEATADDEDVDMDDDDDNNDGNDDDDDDFDITSRRRRTGAVRAAGHKRRRPKPTRSRTGRGGTTRGRGGSNPARRNAAATAADADADALDDVATATALPVQPTLPHFVLQGAFGSKEWYPYSNYNPGAMPRDGTVLLALALAHAQSNMISAALVDSTDAALQYYLNVVGFAPMLPREGHLYHPMHLNLRGGFNAMQLALGDGYKAAVASALASSSDNEVLAELRDAQAILAALRRENDARAAYTLSRVIAEDASLAASAATRRGDRRVWGVYALACERRRRAREAERLACETDADSCCAVCGGADSAPKNLILFCDKCNTPVHQVSTAATAAPIDISPTPQFYFEPCNSAIIAPLQRCYGIRNIPDGDWFCDPCAAGVAPSAVACILCPVRGGPLHPVDSTSGGGISSAHPSSAAALAGSSNRQQWAHVVCARLFAPQTSIVDSVRATGSKEVTERASHSAMAHGIFAPPRRGIVDAGARLDGAWHLSAAAGTAGAPASPSSHGLHVEPRAQIVAPVSERRSSSAAGHAATVTWFELNRGTSTCCVCGSNEGICLECAVPGCAGRIHALCAVECGLVTAGPPTCLAPPPTVVALCEAAGRSHETATSLRYLASTAPPLHPYMLAAALSDPQRVNAHLSQDASRVAWTSDASQSASMAAAGFDHSAAPAPRPTAARATARGAPAPASASTADDAPIPLFAFCSAHRCATPCRLGQGAQGLSDNLVDDVTEERARGTGGTRTGGGGGALLLDGVMVPQSAPAGAVASASRRGVAAAKVAAMVLDDDLAPMATAAPADSVLPFDDVHIDGGAAADDDASRPPYTARLLAGATIPITEAEGWVWYTLRMATGVNFAPTTEVDADAEEALRLLNRHVKPEASLTVTSSSRVAEAVVAHCGASPSTLSAIEGTCGPEPPSGDKNVVTMDVEPQLVAAITSAPAPDELASHVVASTSANVSPSAHDDVLTATGVDAEVEKAEAAAGAAHIEAEVAHCARAATPHEHDGATLNATQTPRTHSGTTPASEQVSLLRGRQAARRTSETRIATKASPVSGHRATVTAGSESRRHSSSRAVRNAEDALAPTEASTVSVDNAAVNEDSAVDDDTQCAVCGEVDSEAENAIVFCDSCGLGVHQDCYGVATLPAGAWHCDPCAAKGATPTSQMPCALCPCTGGALKRVVSDDSLPSTARSTAWVHVVCALWVPEVAFTDPATRASVTGLTRVPAGRWALRCRVCRRAGGAPVQCFAKSCKSAYHVTCGMLAAANGGASGPSSDYYFCSEEVSSGNAGAAGGSQRGKAKKKLDGSTKQSPPRADSDDDSADAVNASYCPKHAAKARVRDVAAGMSQPSHQTVAIPPASPVAAVASNSFASSAATTQDATDVQLSRGSDGADRVVDGSNKYGVGSLLPVGGVSSANIAVPGSTAAAQIGTPHRYPPMLSLTSDASSPLFIPLLRTLVVHYGYKVNLAALATATDVVKRYRGRGAVAAITSLVSQARRYRERRPRDYDDDDAEATAIAAAAAAIASAGGRGGDAAAVAFARAERKHHVFSPAAFVAREATALFRGSRSAQSLATNDDGTVVIRSRRAGARYTVGSITELLEWDEYDVDGDGGADDGGGGRGASRRGGPRRDDAATARARALEEAALSRDRQRLHELETLLATYYASTATASTSDGTLAPSDVAAPTATASAPELHSTVAGSGGAPDACPSLSPASDAAHALGANKAGRRRSRSAADIKPLTSAAVGSGAMSAASHAGTAVAVTTASLRASSGNGAGAPTPTSWAATLGVKAAMTVEIVATDEAGRRVMLSKTLDECTADDTRYCVCRRTYATDCSPMVGCAGCEEWFHMACMRLTICSQHVAAETIATASGDSGDAAPAVGCLITPDGDHLDVSEEYFCPTCSHTPFGRGATK